MTAAPTRAVIATAGAVASAAGSLAATASVLASAAATLALMPAEARAQTPDAAAATLAAGVWAFVDADGSVVVSGSFLGVPPDETLTPAARAARDAFDFRTDDPVLGCGEPGMPRALTAGSPMEFAWKGEDLEIRYESMDVRRRVAMGEPSGPAAAALREPSPNGESVGRWDGTTLVIETTGLDERVMDLLGTPKSSAMRIVERYTVERRGESVYLRADLQLIDPNVFVEPYDWHFDFVQMADWQLLEYACEERPRSLTPGIVAE